MQGQIAVFVNQNTGPQAPVGFVMAPLIPFGPQAASGSIGKAVEASDLNADGVLDLVAVDGNSPNVWVLLGHGSLGLGDATFGAPVSYPTVGTLNQGVAVGDFDHDGAPDLAVVRYGGCNCPTTVTLLAGTIVPGGPSGAFTSAGSVSLPGPSECEDVLAVDLNADGFLDLAVSSYLSIEVAYGAGGFTFNPATYPGGAYPVQLAAGDFSGDGIVDLAAVRNVPLGSGYGNFTVLTGMQGGGFTPYQPLSLSDGVPRCVAAGDFDGDGKLDIAAAHQTGSVDVCLGTCPPSVPRAVTMVWPNGGEVAVPGNMTPMAWSRSASVALVDLDLSHDGGTTWRRVATGVSGISTSWFPPLPGSVSALARVSVSGTPSVSDVSDLPFTIAGAGAAGAVNVGPGCGPSSQPPYLTFAPPRLGHTVAVDIVGATPFAPGVLVSSLAPAAPAAVSPGCAAYLDLGSLWALGGFVTTASGDSSLLIGIPNVLSLAGSVLRAQALIVAPASGLELTNGVELMLGF